LGKDANKNNDFVAIKIIENSKLVGRFSQESLKNEIKILSKLNG
jgi:hypothetical protein